MNACMVFMANRNPEQAALTSKADAFTAPISPCTSQAALGKQWSAEVVPTKIKSSSSGSIPALSKARLAASVAMPQALSPTAIRRWRIPVLPAIHSSLVSTTFAKSSFVTICAGMYEPVPIILLVIVASHKLQNYY